MKLILGLGLTCALIPASLRAAGQDPRARKIGLALSGGGARGSAHIGVLKILEREGIPIDCIAGTSFGAIVGGLYALGYKASEIEQIFTSQDWDSLFSDAPDRRLSPLAESKNLRYLGQLSFEGLSPELPTGLWVGQKMIEVLNSLTLVRSLPAQQDFDRLPIPFRAVATDLLTGKPYIFSRGRMTEALRASFAIPMVFTPVEKDGMLLVDGGLIDNLPTDIVRSMGADIVIAVDATAPLLKKNEIRSFLDVMDQSISLLMRQSVESNRGLADLMLQPELEGYTYRDYIRIPEIIARGEKEAEKKIKALQDLASGQPRRSPPSPPTLQAGPVIDSITFQGLKRLDAESLARDIKSEPGKEVDSREMRRDLSRLYATRLFEHVDCNLEPSGENRYRLVYLLKESPPHTLGASIRYDRDYRFVGLVEGTARQLFGTPSSATVSSQFGGIEDHSAALRYVPRPLSFLFLEPKVHVRRRERNDFREGHFVDQFADKRIGGQLALGGTFIKRLEVEMAYRIDKVTIGGGSAPNQMDGALNLAGLTVRVTRDTLDAQDYPRTGSSLRLQSDNRSRSLGSDVSYTRYRADLERYFSPTPASTFIIGASAGHSRGAMPFFDRFFIGGYNFSEAGSRRLLGFERDELVARQMAILALSYRRRLFSHPLSFVKRGFLGVHYNGAGISDRTTTPYEFSFANGMGVDLALDTMLGPMRIAVAWGERARTKFYLSLGPGF